MRVPVLALTLLGLLATSSPAFAATDDQVKAWATAAAKECEAAFEQAIATKELTPAAVFDRMYAPIPNTDPPKFHTRYDAFTDKVIQPIEEKYLGKDAQLVFVVLVDKNGYLPTHNLKFSKPLTGNHEVDLKGNRSKRMFNDKTGLAAARNEQPFLLQEYKRDTGEEMKDLSVPVMVKGKHWGAIRFGYKK